MLPILHLIVSFTITMLTQQAGSNLQTDIIKRLPSHHSPHSICLPTTLKKYTQKTLLLSGSVWIWYRANLGKDSEDLLSMPTYLPIPNYHPQTAGFLHAFFKAWKSLTSQRYYVLNPAAPHTNKFTGLISYLLSSSLTSTSWKGEMVEWRVR